MAQIIYEIFIYRRISMRLLNKSALCLTPIRIYLIKEEKTHEHFCNTRNFRAYL